GRLRETPHTWAGGCPASIVAPVGTGPTTTRRNIVNDIDKTAGDSRLEHRWWSRTAAAFSAAAVLVLAGPVAALGATTSQGSPPDSSAVPGLSSGRAAGSQMTLAQAPRQLRAAVQSVLGRTGPATQATAQAKLLPHDASAQNVFGASIAISGNTALVGATTANGGPGNGTRAASGFVQGPTGWTQQAKLRAS